jgi:hypothetical protein
MSSDSNELPNRPIDLAGRELAPLRCARPWLSEEEDGAAADSGSPGTVSALKTDEGGQHNKVARDVSGFTSGVSDAATGLVGRSSNDGAASLEFTVTTDPRRSARGFGARSGNTAASSVASS